MPDRNIAIRAFLDANAWADARIAPLAGDASNRRYLRLAGPLGRAVLMDAPAEKGEDIRPFMRIAEYLCTIGLSAPRILAADPKSGLMLLEDLGDDLFARVIPRQPHLEHPLYACATDLLVHLHRATPPKGLAPYSVPLMADMAALAFDWYLAGTTGQDAAARAAFHAEMCKTLERFAPEQSVLIQRDYHSENLLWLPDRDGVARIGLLDFQDAMLGHPAYDLVSLLQDARRDVPKEIEAAMIARYCARPGIDTEGFAAAYHCLGAQRNLRILGVFARLCLRDGKAHYVDLIPRVWGLLMRDLEQPALSELACLVRKTLPSPDMSLLEKLKEQCAIPPSV